MNELDKYLNHCYWEHNKEFIFIYKLVKVDGKYGLLCHEVQKNPCYAWVYEDFPEDSPEFLPSFIPELDPECNAKEISEGHYYELTTKITRLKEANEAYENQVKEFINAYGLE